MTLEQLQTDIKMINALLDAINKVFPAGGQVNQVIAFLEQADQDPLLQNIILLALNFALQQKALKAKLEAK